MKVRFQPEGGSSLSEFIVMLLCMLMLSGICIELTRWYTHRQVLSYALLEAARAGATHHADPKVIEQRFKQASLSLFLPKGRFSSAEERQSSYFRQASLTIDITSPSIVSRNTFLSFRHDQHARIYDSNTLTLQLKYPYKPLIAGLANWINWKSEYLTIQLSHHQMMQSDPVNRTTRYFARLNRPKEKRKEEERDLTHEPFFQMLNLGYDLDDSRGPSATYSNTYLEPLCGINACCEEASREKPKRLELDKFVTQE